MFKITLQSWSKVVLMLVSLDSYVILFLSEGIKALGSTYKLGNKNWNRIDGERLNLVVELATRNNL
jgi:hypothetical protein